MLTHPTTDCLREMELAGMAGALEEQRRQPDNTDLGFEDRFDCRRCLLSFSSRPSA